MSDAARTAYQQQIIDAEAQREADQKAADDKRKAEQDAIDARRARERQQAADAAAKKAADAQNPPSTPQA